MPSQVPQFVMFGSDDNYYADGMNWLVDTAFAGKTNPDGSPAQITFFITAGYGTDQMYGTPPVAGIFTPGNVNQTPQDVVNSWKHAYAMGHEIGNHTWNHAGPANMNYAQTPATVADWQAEINPAQDFLINQVGIPACELDGERYPYLLFNEAGFQAFQGAGFLFDTSVEFGYNWWVPSTCNCNGYGGGSPESGKYYWWPFTLDNGFPSDSNSGFTPNLTNMVQAHAGMWEFLEHTINVPIPGSNPAAVQPITGLDYNLWADRVTTYTYIDVCQDLQYTFLQRYNGNRSPFNFGIHSSIYSPDDATQDMNFNNTATDRRAALQCFIDFLFNGMYPDVRVVGFHKVIEWMRNPTPIH
jgi:peptidoglycan/xylan/chitin deacetylase (PgdA/CDA1 family)